MSAHPCRACGADDSTLQLSVQGRTVRRCRRCSHRFLERRHDDESLTEFYADYAQSSNVSGGSGEYFQGGQEELRANLRRILGRARELVGESSSRVREEGAAPRLLDVGCGSGILLEEARRLGFEIEGIDLAPGLVEHVRERLACPVHRGFLPRLDLPAESFDVVTMYDLIEHVESPPEDLEAARRLLVPGGVLVLLTPNERSLVRWLARCAVRASLGRWSRPLAALYHDQHLSYFTRRSLLRLLRTSGFEARGVTTTNPELGRLYLGRLERWAVRASFAVTALVPPMRTKLLTWAVKPG